MYYNSHICVVVQQEVLLKVILLTWAVLVCQVVETGLLKSQRHGRERRINGGVKREVAQYVPPAEQQHTPRDSFEFIF